MSALREQSSDTTLTRQEICDADNDMNKQSSGVMSIEKVFSDIRTAAKEIILRMQEPNDKRSLEEKNEIFSSLTQAEMMFKDKDYYCRRLLERSCFLEALNACQEKTIQTNRGLFEELVKKCEMLKSQISTDHSSELIPIAKSLEDMRQICVKNEKTLVKEMDLLQQEITQKEDEIKKLKFALLSVKSRSNEERNKLQRQIETQEEHIINLKKKKKILQNRLNELLPIANSLEDMRKICVKNEETLVKEMDLQEEEIKKLNLSLHTLNETVEVNKNCISLKQVDTSINQVKDGLTDNCTVEVSTADSDISVPLLHQTNIVQVEDNEFDDDKESTVRFDSSLEHGATGFSMARMSDDSKGDYLSKYYYDASEAEAWMSEQELYMMREERAKDEIGAQNMMKKHTALENVVEDYAGVVRQLGECSRALINQCDQIMRQSQVDKLYAGLKNLAQGRRSQIAIRQSQVDKLYAGLKDLAQERRSKLEEVLKRYMLCPEIEDLFQWIVEGEVVACSHELGQDFEHVTLLKERFQEFALETESIGTERVAAANHTCDNLIALHHSDSATIAEWKDLLNERWEDLLELIDTRHQELQASWERHKFFSERKETLIN
ncbi:spectrin beta chain, non-erythrocytic 1-like isoform X2 [Dreissena polymorpha]|uniref:spectrin beta chain, non-erythrocytic 1-like isoform X2 n=1 Tax=Dreissena polymorpha TaxID=45954 RepID=UPI002263FEE5|nr:spectrin beta chain, non-erythrocytic 1-like isoform X2 [Dreissena polymorpha]XP_052281710.1 spectrin beta chain, non-erythrocytic 1-like isoform X2 [Dreissena polymorpha]XP_052281712.1 spectrin beta chain, non-erythrocytic 1-like isoform X2 [Dreissena polymorpha]XP_052281713.1 spectrin beta chain, non-erythrocytic 1-like isoform X2 [Dreissena polymorpha]XP_052281714.1 spectrin beta chain, non-erythrocytic 1-like isoform X2 [Dreissena polymorpha]